MISRNIANLYARDGKVALEIAERDILLTYALKLLEEKGWLHRMVFKGGTCLRKFYLGTLTRFSLDLDFTAEDAPPKNFGAASGAVRSPVGNVLARSARAGFLQSRAKRGAGGGDAEQRRPLAHLKKESPDDLILDIAELFNGEYYGIRFSVDPKDFYVREDRLSCGAAIKYSHAFNQSTFDLELSLREPILLNPVSRPLIKTSYSRYLEFPPPIVPCLDLLELRAEKIRASYQRLRSRDVYDLSLLAGQSFDKKLLRLLVVLKFWHVRGEFDPETYLKRLGSSAYDWDDLKRLLRKDQRIDPKSLVRTCVQTYRCLVSLTSEEEKICADTKRHREGKRVKRIEEELK